MSSAATRRPLPHAHRCRRPRWTPLVPPWCLRLEGKPARPRLYNATVLHTCAPTLPPPWPPWLWPPLNSCSCSLPQPCDTLASPLNPTQAPRVACSLGYPPPPHRSHCSSGRRHLAPPSPLAEATPTFNSSTNQALAEHRALPHLFPTKSVSSTPKFRPPLRWNPPRTQLLSLLM
jgi:hypothetical protein